MLFNDNLKTLASYSLLLVQRVEKACRESLGQQLDIRYLALLLEDDKKTRTTPQKLSEAEAEDTTAVEALAVACASMSVSGVADSLELSSVLPTGVPDPFPVAWGSLNARPSTDTAASGWSNEVDASAVAIGDGSYMVTARMFRYRFPNGLHPVLRRPRYAHETYVSMALDYFLCADLTNEEAVVRSYKRLLQFKRMDARNQYRLPQEVD